MLKLYGIIASTTHDDIVATSGCEGSIQISTLVSLSQRTYVGSRGGSMKERKLSLRREGPLLDIGLQNALVTCTSMKFDD